MYNRPLEKDFTQILQNACPAINAEKVMTHLLDRFGSVKNIMEASALSIEHDSEIPASVKRFLTSIVPMIKAWQAAQTDDETLQNVYTLSRYCKSLLAGDQNESMYVIAVNCRCNVIANIKISEGTLSEVSAYPRKVLKAALDTNAHGVFMTHNHPGGTCAPSAEDISSTLRLQKLLKGAGIMLFDHVIVAGDNTYSMCEHGDISFR